MRKLISTVLLLLSVNAYADSSSAAAAAATGAASIAAIEATHEQTQCLDSNVQIGILLCSKLQDNDMQADCLIKLQQQVQQQRTDQVKRTTVYGLLALALMALFVLLYMVL